jgi:hypothetical protein
VTAAKTPSRSIGSLYSEPIPAKSASNQDFSVQWQIRAIG